MRIVLGWSSNDVKRSAGKFSKNPKKQAVWSMERILEHVAVDIPCPKKANMGTKDMSQSSNWQGGLEDKHFRLQAFDALQYLLKASESLCFIEHRNESNKIFQYLGIA